MAKGNLIFRAIFHQTRDTTAETVRPFYIASLDDSPENISKYIRDHRRDHRQVENSLHRVLDVAFRQDEYRIGAGHAAVNSPP